MVEININILKETIIVNGLESPLKIQNFQTLSMEKVLLKSKDSKILKGKKACAII